MVRVVLEVLKNFFGVEVDLVGDVMLDAFMEIVYTGRSAEDLNAGCYDIISEMRLPGGVGCTARCVKALGGEPKLYSVIGVGSTARRLQDVLRKYGILNQRIIPIPGRRTTEKRRYIEKVTQRQCFVTQYVCKDPIPEEFQESLIGSMRGTKSKVVLVSDYKRGVVTEGLAQKVSEFARENNKYLIVDGRERPLKWYLDNMSGLDLITPNRREAEVMLGRELRTIDQVEAAGREIRDRLRCDVFLKLSEQGARLFVANSYENPEERRGKLTAQGEEYAYPAYNEHNVVCVSGAGDTMAATIALCIGAGIELPVACEIASRAAAITVSKPGSEVASLDELKISIASAPDFNPNPFPKLCPPATAINLMPS